MSSGFAESHVEEAALATLARMATRYGDVLLVERLRSAIAKLNPTAGRSARQVDADGDALAGRREPPTASLHDRGRPGRGAPCRWLDQWRTGPIDRLRRFGRNDWLAVNQYTVIENKANRRPDVRVIPTTLVAELSGMGWALVLAAQGPRYLSSSKCRKTGHPVLELAISLLAVPVFWAFAEWRLGLLLCLVTAILQDPLRKLTPDQPVLFVGFVGVVFGAACLGALARGISLDPNSIFRRYRQLRDPFVALAAADHRASIQFLFAFRQSVDTADWAIDVCAAIAIDYLRIPAGFSPG